MKVIVWSIFSFLLSFSLSAQDAKYYKQLGLQLLSDQQYEEALQSLLAYYRIHPDNNEILLKIAICSYYVDEIEEMERYLNRYEQQGEKKNASYLIYSARLLRAKGKYYEAALAYKKYLKMDEEASTRRNNAIIELKQCGMGVRLQYQNLSFVVSNAGELVNSNFDDLCPIASPNHEQTFYFSSNRRGNMDIYRVENDTSTAQTLERNVNTGTDESLLGFGCGGEWLYFTRDSVGVMIDSFDSFQIHTLELPDAIQVENLFFFCDSVLLFSSNELEGLGGSDLYFCRQIEDVWSAPQNFGKPINSEYDEVAPFLDKDGRTFYFSSNHPDLSLGKFDILKSVYDLESEQWSNPENMGTAINSYANEVNLFIQAKGKTAYFSSDNWLGNGSWDIYHVTMDGIAKRQRPYLLFDDVRSMQQQQLAKNMDESGKDLLYYRIKIAEKSILKEDFIPASFPSPYIQLDSIKQSYSYYFGRYQSFESAYEWYKEAKKNGWENATLVAYVKDQALSKNAVQQLKEKHEDLIYFWQYLEQE